MKISVRTRLAVDIDTAWEMLHTPRVFQTVSWPFTVFQAREAFPARFTPDTDYEVRVFAFGIIPLGRQIIRLEDDVDSWLARRTTDCGRGASGPLGMITRWRHQMSLEARADGSVDFSDQLSANASFLTPLLWPAFAVFWRWRLFRLRQLAKSMTSSATTSWNTRYAQSSQMWSGKVNPVLEEVASLLPPGSALDIGAGEGGDALWLAEHGWDVHAHDASSVAIYRGVIEASRRGVEVSWKVSDLDSDGLPEGAFDLVSLQFIHLPEESRQRVWREAAARVAPGGTLLIVGHSVKDFEAGVRRPPRELLFDRSSFETLDPASWSSWSVTERERTVATGDQTAVVWDVVLVAKR